MADTALIFDRAAPASRNLVFGETGDVAPPSELSITGVFPALTARISFVERADLTVTGAFPALQAIAEVSYHTNTQRPTVAQLHDTAQISRPTESGLTHPQQHAQRTSSGTEADFTEATRHRAGSTTGFDNALRLPTVATAPFQDGTQTRNALDASMQEGDRQWLHFYSQFQEADRVYARLFGAFEDGVKVQSGGKVHKFQEAAKRPAKGYTGRATYAVPIPRHWQGEFQDARVAPPGLHVPAVPPITPPLYIGPHLLFACPPLDFPALVFGLTQCQQALPGGATLYILPARYYMTAHTIYAQRLPDLAEVPIFDATVAADSGSYCWSLSASGPVNLFELLAPAGGLPVQLKLTLDGIPFVFAIDSISRSQQFGQTGVRVQGSSVTSLIGAPYMASTSRIETEERTAQQLAEAALSGTGIALDWGTGAGALANGGLIDWLVPAGAYSRQGTPLEAVSRIAQAAGGYLQSHRSAATLLTRHPYGMRAGDASGAPWLWHTGAPDVELAPDAIITSAIERKDGPDINAVYVSGTSSGVLALVKRSGSAGDKLADMLTDSLITHADAARQKGLSVLGAAGPKYHITLELPVLTGTGQPGVLDVGQLVQVNATQPWRARVRSVSVSAKQPRLRQSVTLERHLEAA